MSLIFLKDGGTAIEFYERYRQNKSKCGAKKKELAPEDVDYILEKTQRGWAPDVIMGERNGT